MVTLRSGMQYNKGQAAGQASTGQVPTEPPANFVTPQSTPFATPQGSPDIGAPQPPTSHTGHV